MSPALVIDIVAIAGFYVLAIWISIVDIRTHLIRNLEVVVGVLFLLAAFGLQLIWTHDLAGFLFALLGGVINGVFYFLLRLVIPRQLGAGDPGVAVMAGLFLGHFCLGAALLGLVVPYACSAIPALIVLSKRGRGARLAFGPFILLSTPISLAIAALYAH